MRDHAQYKDQVRYSTDQVESLIPGVFDPDFILSARPAKGVTDGVGRGTVDPKHIPDWLMSVADVQVGFRRGRLDEAERTCLRFTRHLGYTPTELAGIWGETPERIHRACDSGIRKICSYLNGEVPA